MKNYKMVVTYDGSRYKGWQRLGKGELTIQTVLEDAVQQALDYKVEIHGSGRTDAGVHARGQVVSMKVPFALKDSFVSNINEGLPEDIKVVSVERVKGDFHARYSATGKRYQYYVDTKEKPSVFQRKYAWHYPYELDFKAMQKAAVYLTGTHDFSSFTDDKMEEKDKVRTIFEIRIERHCGILEFIYHGDGFLQHMIRILTGTLLEIGKGEKKPEDINVILEKRERTAAGVMVPAKGLFLDSVDYD